MAYDGTDGSIAIASDGLTVTLGLSAPAPVPFSSIRAVDLMPAFMKHDGTFRITLKDGREQIVKFAGAQQQDFAHLQKLVSARIASLRPRPDGIICTTTLEVPGRQIVQVLDVISAETVLGVNILKDIANAWRDVLGGRSKSTQGALRDARKVCLDELRVEAAALGADAVVAVDLDYSEFSSSIVSGGMVMVIATGTAVRLGEATS